MGLAGLYSISQLADYFLRILSDARNLTEFPLLNGTEALEILRLDRGALTDVPSTLCLSCPRLKSL